jgi:hypothetical protein
MRRNRIISQTCVSAREHETAFAHLVRLKRVVSMDDALPLGSAMPISA